MDSTRGDKVVDQDLTIRSHWTVHPRIHFIRTQFADMSSFDDDACLHPSKEQPKVYAQLYIGIGPEVSKYLDRIVRIFGGVTVDCFPEPFDNSVL